jgi:hypothetical protein
MLATFTPYVFYGPVLRLALDVSAAPTATIVASLPSRSSARHALVCLEDALYRSKASHDKATSEQTRAMYCDNLDVSVCHIAVL